MTRSKIQKMKFFVFLLIFLLAHTAYCDETFWERRSAASATNVDRDKVKEKVDEPASAAVAHKNGDRSSASGSASVDARPVAETSNGTRDDAISKPSGQDAAGVVANKTVHTGDASDEHSDEEHTIFNIHALMRGFFVFMVLSILVMVYIMFRSVRLSKTRAQMVRKYGVLTHRQDVEMRPLPLEEEDDEDTTVFDASNVLTNNVQHRNA